jgi:signal transduction histidine kinase
VRLVDLPRTTSFQLGLRFLLLFGAASLALFGFLYWQTAHYVERRIDDWLKREQAVFTVSDPMDLRRRLAAHLVADPSLERPLTLFDPTGRRVAGTDLDLPATELTTLPRDQLTKFVIQQAGRTIAFRAIVHQRQSGYLFLVARDMADARTFDRILIGSFIWGGLFTMFLGLTGAAIVGADSVQRIDGITRAIQRIVSGDLSERLPTHGRRDDFDRLAHVINGMLGELERLMQEVKGVCDNIAHDLRTPLTRLLAGLERTRRRAGPVEDHAAAIDEAIVEMRGILKTFAAMLRISEVESGARRAGFTDTDLSEVLADVVEFYEPVAEAKGVRLWLASDGVPMLMRGDPNLLFEVVGNLVDNGLKFTPSGGCVTVRGLGTIGFEVEDSGPGIPAAEREAVQRRFYRSEASRHTEGSGLGLALVAAVARLHGMDLAITDANPGCRITVSRQESTMPSDPAEIADRGAVAEAAPWLAAAGPGNAPA